MTSSDEQPDLRAPTRIEQLDVSVGLVEDLFARRLFVDKTGTIGGLSKSISISQSIGQSIAEGLRDKKMLEYLGADGRDYRVGLTTQGEQTMSDRMSNAGYLTSTPVSLSAYEFVVTSQSVEVQLTRDEIRKHLSDLVVEDRLIDQLGPAFLSDGAVFMYGPPGTGKTSLAKRFGRFVNDEVLIPRFVEVDSQLISVFDPSIHVPAETQPDGLDPRWVSCERPLVIVGGELQLEALDLRYDSVSGLHTPPLQMLANNGVLLVDDFGRQTAKPDQILNRWIVPLSTGVDYLRPRSGTKFTVPFNLKLVMSTNLDPTDLGDEAFLRRLPNKIYVGAMSENAFNWSLVRAADRLKLEVKSDSAKYLGQVACDHIGELRPYIAVDFCEMACRILDYDNAARVLTPETIDRVADLFFVRREDKGKKDTLKAGKKHEVTPPAKDKQTTEPEPFEADLEERTDEKGCDNQNSKEDSREPAKQSAS